MIGTKKCVFNGNDIFSFIGAKPYNLLSFYAIYGLADMQFNMVTKSGHYALTVYCGSNDETICNISLDIKWYF